MSFWKWLKELWQRQPAKKQQAPPLPSPRIFNSCEIVKSPPSNGAIPYGKFFVVKPGQELKWALFKCPCKCGHVITLSLASGRTPQWTVRSDDGYPTLYPSVRQLNGCLSHFWIKRGRVQWCDDTGKPYSPM